MKYNLELLKTDIGAELEKLNQLKIEFDNKIEGLLKLEAEAVPNYDRGAVGYVLHTFYNGCENIFRLIAKFFENNIDTDRWHSNLLMRMKLAVPGFRPKVIDEELFRLLDDFRSFRHKFRHSYSFELDWEKEILVAKKFPIALKMTVAQVSVFLDEISTMDLSE